MVNVGVICMQIISVRMWDNGVRFEPLKIEAKEMQAVRFQFPTTLETTVN